MSKKLKSYRKSFYFKILVAFFFIVLSSLSSMIFAKASDSYPVSSPKTSLRPFQVSSIVPSSPVKAYEYKLANGLRVVLIPDKRNPIATLHFILNAGSDREFPGKTGLAHFFEHMMFRKTKGTPEGNYDRILSSVGGRGNAATSDSFVTYYSTFPGPALETMLQLEAARFMKLDLTDPYFSTEKGAVLSERKLRLENDPMQRGAEVLRAITERGTPLEWMTIGSKKDVEGMTIEAAQKFYDSFYTPANTIMVVGGPFDPEKVISLIKQHFDAWKEKAVPPIQAFPKNYLTRDLGKTFICSEPVTVKSFRIIYPSFSANPRSYAYFLAFQALLDNNSEGTFERRLAKQNLASQFYFYKVFWENQSRPLIASFTLNKEQSFDAVKKFWLDNVEAVSQKIVSRKIKDQLLKQVLVDNASTAERMTSLTNNALENLYFFKTINLSYEIQKTVREMTTQSLHDWIKENLSIKGFYVTGVVQTGEATPCSDFYTQFKKSQK